MRFENKYIVLKYLDFRLQLDILVAINLILYVTNFFLRTKYFYFHNRIMFTRYIVQIQLDDDII